MRANAWKAAMAKARANVRTAAMAKANTRTAAMENFEKPPLMSMDNHERYEMQLGQFAKNHPMNLEQKQVEQKIYLDVQEKLTRACEDDSYNPDVPKEYMLDFNQLVYACRRKKNNNPSGGSRKKRRSFKRRKSRRR